MGNFEEITEADHTFRGRENGRDDDEEEEEEGEEAEKEEEVRKLVRFLAYGGPRIFFTFLP